MSISANGNNITAVYANGTDITRVYVNGTQYWTKTPPAGTWTNAWSGLAYIYDPDNTTVGQYSYTHTFAGVSASTLQGKTVQVDAKYNFVFDGQTSVTNLTAARDDYTETGNLPLTPPSSAGTQLSALQLSGASVQITGTANYNHLWGNPVYGYFTVSNIWYYNKS